MVRSGSSLSAVVCIKAFPHVTVCVRTAPLHAITFLLCQLVNLHVSCYQNCFGVSVPTFYFSCYNYFSTFWWGVCFWLMRSQEASQVHCRQASSDCHLVEMGNGWQLKRTVRRWLVVGHRFEVCGVTANVIFRHVCLCDMIHTHAPPLTRLWVIQTWPGCHSDATINSACIKPALVPGFILSSKWVRLEASGIVDLPTQHDQLAYLLVPNVTLDAKFIHVGILQKIVWAFVSVFDGSAFFRHVCSLKKTHPIGQNVAWLMCAFAFISLYTYLWLPKLNCEPSRGQKQSSRYI